MEFGSFMEFPPINAHGAASGDSAAFDRALDEIETAERVGLDVAWLAELHGAPERSVLSAPMMVASAIAARTSRIKIGIAVQVLPLSHPLRLAEEAATIDQISHGRLIYGIGRSGVVRTYEDYGIAYAESRERFAETLEILKLAWTEPAFSYAGKYHSFNNVAATPKPYQKPYPELRMAAATPRPSRRSASSACRSLSRCARARSRNWPSTSRPIARPTRRPAIRGAARCFCGSRPTSPKQGSAPGPRPRRA